MKVEMRSTRHNPIRIVILAGMLLSATALAGCAHGVGLVTSDAGADASIFNGLMAFYDGPLNHMVGVRRGSCPMYPSCSEYSRQAVAAHGAVVGWVMSMDRLLRCGRNELQIAPKALVHGNWKSYDPLAANDGWWAADDERKAQLPPITP
jgi:putative component of membrane protein insertase Oxa1/YidC/SpoIIIJ protein YidD